MEPNGEAVVKSERPFVEKCKPVAPKSLYALLDIDLPFRYSLSSNCFYSGGEGKKKTGESEVSEQHLRHIVVHRSPCGLGDKRPFSIAGRAYFTRKRHGNIADA